MANSIARGVVAGWLAIFILAGAALAASPITVRVRDANGAGVAGLRVTLQNLINGNLLGGTTGGEGQARFLRSPPGPYGIQVGGQRVGTRYIRLGAEGGALVDIPLHGLPRIASNNPAGVRRLRERALAAKQACNTEDYLHATAEIERVHDLHRRAGVDLAKLMDEVRGALMATLPADLRTRLSIELGDAKTPAARAKIAAQTYKRRFKAQQGAPPSPAEKKVLASLGHISRVYHVASRHQAMVVAARDALAAAKPAPEAQCRTAAAPQPGAPTGGAQAAGDFLGTWVIQPYYTSGGGSCGRIKYTGWIVVEERVTANHFRGQNFFHWDLSGLGVGCTMQTPTSGSGSADLFVDGDRVTIKYGPAGGMKFTDDHLIRSGSTLRGQDNAGNVIIYRRKVSP